MRFMLPSNRFGLKRHLKLVLICRFCTSLPSVLNAFISKHTHASHRFHLSGTSFYFPRSHLSSSSNNLAFASSSAFFFSATACSRSRDKRRIPSRSMRSHRVRFRLMHPRHHRCNSIEALISTLSSSTSYQPLHVSRKGKRMALNQPKTE